MVWGGFFGNECLLLGSVSCIRCDFMLDKGLIFIISSRLSSILESK